jgi:hypothetical protein
MHQHLHNDQTSSPQQRRKTHDVLRIDLLDKARILCKVHVCTEGDFVDRHPALNLLTVHADKVFWLFEQVLRDGSGQGRDEETQKRFSSCF